MNRGADLTDLTLYDHDVPMHLLSKLSCIRIIYCFFLLPNMILVGFEVLSIMSYFNVLSAVVIMLNVFGIVCSISYVFFPKSKIARTMLTKVVLTIFTMISILSFIIVVFAIMNFDFDDSEDFDDDWEDYYPYLVTFLIIAYMIPIFHCFSLFVIYRIRKRMALAMMISYNANHSNQPPQNANLGNRYQPPVAQVQYVQPNQNIQQEQPLRQVQPMQQYQQVQQPQNNVNTYRQVLAPNQYLPQPQAYSQQNLSSNLPAPSVAQPLNANRSKSFLNNPILVSDHPYINQQSPDDEASESESLLSSSNRRSSFGFQPRIN